MGCSLNLGKDLKADSCKIQREYVDTTVHTLRSVSSFNCAIVNVTVYLFIDIGTLTKIFNDGQSSKEKSYEAQTQSNPCSRFSFGTRACRRECVCYKCETSCDPAHHAEGTTVLPFTFETRYGDIMTIRIFILNCFARFPSIDAVYWSKTFLSSA